MHGGFSGSLVLRVDACDADGRREEPTVAKLDDGLAMVREVRQTRVVMELVGEEAIRVMRGPVFLGPDGQEKEQSVRVLEMADKKIDGPLKEQIQRGAIRLLKCRWLLSDQANDVLKRDSEGNVLMSRSQDLPDEAFFSPDEACRLFVRGERSVFVLSYCWLTADHPY